MGTGQSRYANAELNTTVSWSTTSWTLTLILFLTVSCLIQAIRNRFRPSLRRIPGPFLARIADLDRVWSCARGEQMNYHRRLHDKYGPVVRVGPNHVSFSDGSLIPQLYGFGSKFAKSDFYKMFDIRTRAAASKGSTMTTTTFSERDELRHRALKRPVGAAFSMSTMKELEPLNDVCSAILTRKLEGLVGRDTDLGDWVHWYAWDVISSITFSHRLGFLDRETDIHGINRAIQGRLVYNSVIGQVPYLHGLLFGNALFSWLAGFVPRLAVLNSSSYIVDFTREQLRRYQDKESNTVEAKDLLSRFKRFRDGEQVMSDAELLMHASGSVFAGSDTTAISLRALFYYLCRNPDSKRKLLAEIDEAETAGRLSDPVTFAEALELEYLQAIIKEALRIHPAVGLLLERIVPPGGTQLGDVWLEEGTVVGINPWVATREKAVYGEDADTFRPERWLEAGEKELKLMERNFLALFIQFGGGSRTCLGKNVSLLEISKLVPQLLRQFDFELSYPEREWELYDYWFVAQKGLICRVSRRQKEGSV
ncbi:hypothetical protein M406DRAFT_51514 [Cryphonectria parasitica EP155]|uniref:Pisatin demethylase n=1 Tax=Cryphonectria parasitica (strain ATCC 38755 / EP155) TaxID=660469 RepID=A0A9P4Y010_CRYP1|nr:uncharacterized protein M406DRAFT_51514 [Cryphonectria parasitica EP155]KAF3763900.1 hypothetical protein M406DRAFT_51514 [Cryphonectria parasitica EP155]